MDRRVFHDHMTALSAADEGERHAEGLVRARQLKATLLADDHPDAAHVGWARYYELKSLYSLGDWRGAHDLLESTEPCPWEVSATNAAWMASVGAEVAMRLELPDGVVRRAGEALRLRLSQDDAAGAAMAAATGLYCLRRLKRADLGGELVRYLLGHGEGADLIAGFEHVAEMSPAPPDDVQEIVTDCLEALLLLDPPLSTEVHVRQVNALRKVTGSAWYRARLSNAERAALELGEALWEAADDGDIAEVERLLEAGAAPDFRHLGRPGLPTPLVAAAFAGRTAVVQTLVRQRVDLDVINFNGRTAVQLAADQGHADAIAALAEAGADLANKDVFGLTALHIAAWQDHGAAVEALLAAGAEVDTPGGDYENSALGLACTEEVPETVAALADAGANLEFRNSLDQTPLMLAAMEGCEAVARLLVGRGADPSAMDTHGMSALDWARQEEHAAVVRLLSE